MVEDKIEVIVKQNTPDGVKNLRYRLSYEDFSLVNQVLSQCKDVEEVNPMVMPELFPTAIFDAINSSNKKTVIYDTCELPNGKSIDDVVKYYNKTGFIQVQKRNPQYQLNTKMGFLWIFSYFNFYKSQIMKKKDYKKKNKTMQYITMALCGVLCCCAGADIALQHYISAIADFVFIGATILFIYNSRLFDEYIELSENRFADEFTIRLIIDLLKGGLLGQKDKEEK